jgi:hypothetical protein
MANVTASGLPSGWVGGVGCAYDVCFNKAFWMYIFPPDPPSELSFYLSVPGGFSSVTEAAVPTALIMNEETGEEQPTLFLTTVYGIDAQGGYFGGWHSWTDPEPDTDSDGYLDSVDQCPASILTPTVCVGNCDSLVPNTLFASGCTISDKIDLCAEGVTKRGQYMSCVSGYLDDLVTGGILTGKQQRAIKKCTR